jgi:alpha-mannosidase
MGGDLLVGWAPDAHADATAVRRACRAWAHPAYAHELPLLPHLAPTGPPRPRRQSWLSVGDPRLELAALRPEPGGSGIALRLYNPTGEPVRTRVQIGLPLRRIAPSDLRDRWDEGQSEPLAGGTFDADLPPYACRTWVLRP